MQTQSQQQCFGPWYSCRHWLGRVLHGCTLTLFAVACLGQVETAGLPLVLVDIEAGQVPNDTGMENQTRLTVVEHEPLGGRALEVRFARNDSFGNSNPGTPDWRGQQVFTFTADNPGSRQIPITLVVRHGGSVSYGTRADTDIVLEPGINYISIPLRDMRNNDGSLPDFSNVRQWYLAIGDEAPTLYFSNLALNPYDPTSERLAALLSDQLPDAIALTRSFHITGTLGGESVDLIIEASDSTVTNSISSRQTTTPRQVVTDPLRLARIRSTPMPDFNAPVLFNTPEADAIVSALEVFPPDNAFNELVSAWPLHPDSSAIIASIGANEPFRYNLDMGYILVPPNQLRKDVVLTLYAEESDPGPYPVPENVPIEGWPAVFSQGINRILGPSLRELQETGTGDRHAIVVDPVNRILYEFANMYRVGDGWTATQASIFDLKTNNLRPDGWTSADAAGLPLFPAVVRYDELVRGEIEHALRFTAPRTRRAYVSPATHYASRSDDPNLPRMGERFRLRADYDISGFSAHAQTILRALKKYGMLLADNGIAWAVSIAPDERIPDMNREFRRIKGSDFEVVTPP